MFKLLPIIFIFILLLAGLGYWRYMASKPKLTTPAALQEPIEVPKTLPTSSLEDRVKSLEELATKLVTQVNDLKSKVGQTQSSNASNASSQDVDAPLTELKARVSALEKATPAPASSSQSTVYIPLGSGGGPWGDKDWYSTSEYEISLDPASYPGYKSMVLEVTFRLAEAAGTGSVRLYNSSDSSAVSGQLDTTSTSFGLKTSSSFTLPAGSKTYKLQVKSSQGANLHIQSARIKVNF